MLKSRIASFTCCSVAKSFKLIFARDSERRTIAENTINEVLMEIGEGGRSE